jgi:hypothetical protein
MTAIAQQLRYIQPFFILAITLAISILSASAIDGAIGGLINVILKAIAEAYIQVSSFVAATLFLFYGAEKFAKIDLEKLLANAEGGQVVYAALLGALPGCGGAIIVVTQYVTGRLSFGAVTAVLTATMGDAAFLLIAQEPFTGIAMVIMGFTVGVICGYIVDAIHGKDFLRQPLHAAAKPLGDSLITGHGDAGVWLSRVWLIIFIPGIVFGVMAALQIDSDAIFGTALLPTPSLTIGAVGGILSVLMFIVPRFIQKYGLDRESSHPYLPLGVSSRVISDTNFVTTWVVAAFLLFEVSVYVFGIDLHDVFKGYLVFAPLIATLLGFIPGCGPQVLVTTLYLAGAIPLSAQISNAISNDGDALFPAIAIAPKVAIVATAYSAIPAILIGYSWMVFVEGL